MLHSEKNLIACTGEINYHLTLSGEKKTPEVLGFFNSQTRKPYLLSKLFIILTTRPTFQLKKSAQKRQVGRIHRTLKTTAHIQAVSSFKVLTFKGIQQHITQCVAYHCYPQPLHSSLHQALQDDMIAHSLRLLAQHHLCTSHSILRKSNETAG